MCTVTLLMNAATLCIFVEVACYVCVFIYSSFVFVLSTSDFTISYIKRYSNVGVVFLLSSLWGTF